jgi:tryptophan halogenase
MRIVVAGGGTAGWLSALFISKIFPEHQVTVIENTQIGIIGTGEGSTGLLRAVIKNKIFDFGCNEIDFIRKTGSFPKLGIKFTNWNKEKYISPIDGSVMQNENFDTFSLHVHSQGLPAHLSSEQGHRIDLNKIPFMDTKLSPSGGLAYHFDGVKVGEYFKGLCNTVKVVDDTILDFSIDEKGNINKLILENSKIDCDFIIDCLGFSSIFTKKIFTEFQSYEKHLPVNTAIPFQLPNTDIYRTEITTESRALKYGWMWKIPVGNRYGCGYVFNGNLITPEQAQEEVESYMGRKIDPIKVIKFTSGKRKELWKHNVLSIGLSSGFLEPLQATAIHTVISHLQHFCFSFLIDSNSLENQGCRDLYNRQAGAFFDDFADFINLHYQCGRNDSEFWKYMQAESATDRVKNIMEIFKTRILTKKDFNLYANAAGNSLWNPILLEMNLLTRERSKELLKFYSNRFEINHEIDYKKIQNEIINQSSITMKEYVDTFIDN